MTVLKHTPGPWQYNQDSANRVTGPKGETVAAVYSGLTGTAEQVANTSLVAAAPTMLGYIAKKAGDGDEEAQGILDSLQPTA